MAHLEPSLQTIEFTMFNPFHVAFTHMEPLGTTWRIAPSPAPSKNDWKLHMEQVKPFVYNARAMCAMCAMKNPLQSVRIVFLGNRRLKFSV